MQVSLLTQQYLRENGLPAFIEQFKIKPRRHGRYQNLVHLKYNQIESPMHEPIVQECRGLILDVANDWVVVAFPFHKFFNAGEPLAVDVDWSTARVQEKLDGSLMTLYRYDDAWQVSSSGLPDAAGPVKTIGGTFADLFWNTWNTLKMRLPEPGCCYMFELMTPMNRIVVQHREPKLVLIGVRDLTTLKELPVEPVAERHGWSAVRSLPLSTCEQCIEAAKALDPMSAEGFVVVDADFRRVKIKSPRYVAIAHAIDHASPRRMLELVRSNESAEYLAYFPDLQSKYNAMAERFAAVCREIDAIYAALASIRDQKQFAAAALKTNHSAALFAIRSRRARDARDFLSTCTTQLLEKAIPVEESPQASV